MKHPSMVRAVFVRAAAAAASLSAAVFLSSFGAIAAELRVPGYTAYLEPEPYGAEISVDRGLTHWTDPRARALWVGLFTNTGKVHASVEVRLPTGGQWPLELAAAGQKRSAQVVGAGSDPLRRLDFGSFDIPAAGPVRWTLTSLNQSGESAGQIVALLLDGPAAEGARFNLKERRNAASVHLIYDTPASARIAAFYCEVTAVEDPPATFYMACGWHRGYFGMQVNSPTERRIIFSVWDSGGEKDDRGKVAAANRVRLSARGDGVVTGDFGNEGTGGHSHRVYPWKTGVRQRFLVTAKPIDGTTTVFSGFFDDQIAGHWTLISSWLAPHEGGWLRGLHSFSEDFDGANGHLRRKARFGNQWIQNAQGEWLEITRARFSHDPTGRADRWDRFMGVEEGQFFLSHGGFSAESSIYGAPFTRPAVGKAPAIELPPIPSSLPGN